MKKMWMAFAGMGLGAAAMYFADPQRGRRRRARVREAALEAAETIQEAAGTASRDLEHRFSGVAKKTAAALGRTRGGARPWTPAARVITGAAGLALLAAASRQRSVRGAAVGAAAYELLERAVRAARHAA